MKKIILSFLIIGTSLFSSDYMNVGISSYSETLSDEYDTTIEYSTYNIRYFQKERKYLLSLEYVGIPSQTSRIRSLNIDYDYTYKGSSYNIFTAYKGYRNNNIFAGPIISYNKINLDTKKIKVVDSTFAEYTYTDSDLSFGAIIGYDYGKDNFCFIAYELYSDLLDKEEYDTNTLTLSVYHKLEKKLSIGFSYYTNLSNEDGIAKSEGLKFEIGSKFFYD